MDDIGSGMRRRRERYSASDCVLEGKGGKLDLPAGAIALRTVLAGNPVVPPAKSSREDHDGDHLQGEERIASAGCSDRTIRRRRREWAAAGLSERVHTLALRAYDRMIGLDLEDLAVDGCLTRRHRAGRSRAGRRWIGANRGSSARS